MSGGVPLKDIPNSQCTSNLVNLVVPVCNDRKSGIWCGPPNLRISTVEMRVNSVLKSSSCELAPYNDSSSTIAVDGDL